MASGISQYLANKLLDHSLGKTSFTMPATVAVALVTVAPVATDTGATITEANYTGYARKVIAASDLAAASGGASTNANAIVHDACTAGSSAVIGVVILDSSTIGAGNVLWMDDIASKTIDTTSTPPTIAAGALDIALTLAS